MAKNKLDNVIHILSCVLVVILVIVLLFTRERTNNIFQSIVIWLIVYIMSYWCTKSIHKSLATSILLIIVISFINCRGGIVENFELEKIDKDETVSEEEDGDFMKKKVNDTKEMIESLDKMILNKNMDLKSTEFNALDPTEIGNMLKFSASDKESEKNGNLNSDKKNLSPAEAQRETFHLIDTVKQLDETIKALGPTLTQGKQIMNMFDKIKL